MTDEQMDAFEAEGLTLENMIDYFNYVNHSIYKMKKHKRF